MELTEKERLLLVEKKEEIRVLTEDIIELTADIKKNKTELKKKVEGILPLISTIACYTNPKFDMRLFAMAAQYIFHLIDMEPCLNKVVTTDLEIFCNVANSMTFNFTKNGLKVKIEKIDLSIFRTGK
jgi:hypothetical protein